MPAGVENKPKNRKPNVFDVARLAGVSQTTVSFVLNGSTSPRISEATSRRVMEAVAQLGYRPNTLAKGLAHGKTNTIGMVLPFFDEDFHGNIVRECQATLAEHGYQLLFVHAQSGSLSENRMVEFLLQHRVDAIACFAHSETKYILPDWLQTIETAGVPAVVIDHASPQADSVYSDDYAGMDLVVQHLYSLGHRKIGLLTKRFSEDLVPDKIRGFDESMRRLGLDARLRICEDDPNPTKQDYTAEILRLLATADAPTAFVAFNDYQLEDFLQVHREHGVRIPEDVSLAGYGDSYLSRFAGLTTVCQHPDLIGRAVAERLLGHLDDPTLPTTKVKLPSKLVVRNSTAAPKR